MKRNQAVRTLWVIVPFIVLLFVFLRIFEDDTKNVSVHCEKIFMYRPDDTIDEVLSRKTLDITKCNVSGSSLDLRSSGVLLLENGVNDWMFAFRQWPSFRAVFFLRAGFNSVLKDLTPDEMMELANSNETPHQKESPLDLEHLEELDYTNSPLFSPLSFSGPVVGTTECKNATCVIVCGTTPVRNLIRLSKFLEQSGCEKLIVLFKTGESANLEQLPAYLVPFSESDKRQP